MEFHWKTRSGSAPPAFVSLSMYNLLLDTKRVKWI